MIALRSSSELERMAEAGAIADECMQMVLGLVSAGISTWELDREAESFIRKLSG